MIDKRKAALRLGATRTMNCNIDATIIAYRSAKDIDVQFEDGQIVTNRRYQHFLDGQISHPSKTGKQRLANKINESKMMNCGKTATIIACRSYRDIDVKFENGIIVKNRRYSDFQNGMIAYPGYFRELYLTDKTGESRVVNCGLKATIITYVNCKNIDIQFEDGVIVRNRRYEHFKTGKIGHPLRTSHSKIV